MFSTNYLFDLPQELQEIIYEKKHQMEHKEKTKSLMKSLNSPSEIVYCSGCGRNIMNEALTFYKNDLKTYINIGENCCFQGLTLCDEERCNFKEYLNCYEDLKDVSDDDFNNNRLFIKVEDENNYVYGYGYD